MGDRPQPGDPPGHPQRCPFVVRCPPGRYAYCRCQQSRSFPYCDGSHRALPAGTDPERATPLKVEITEERMVAWCCCGWSGRLPFCDGSHA